MSDDMSHLYKYTPAADPRDAEIASLRAALAAGPAALRGYAETALYVPSLAWAAEVVDEAQRRALGET
jgi:hypothetical protein